MPEGIVDTTRSLLTSAANVRSLSGATSARDINDADLQLLIQRAQSIVIGDISHRVENLPLEGARDGSTTRYGIPRRAVSRIIVDDTLNLTTDGTDVLVQLRDDPTAPAGWPTYTTATVSSIDATHGIITLSSAPAATVDAVEFSGRLMSRTVDKIKLSGLVELYAAHLLGLRLTEGAKQVLASPQPETRPTPKSHWLDAYLREIAPFRSGRPRAATRNTSITGRLDDGLRSHDPDGRLYGSL